MYIMKKCTESKQAVVLVGWSSRISCVHGKKEEAKASKSTIHLMGVKVSLTYTVRALNPNPTASGIFGSRDFGPSANTGSQNEPML